MTRNSYTEKHFLAHKILLLSGHTSLFEISEHDFIVFTDEPQTIANDIVMETKKLKHFWSNECRGKTFSNFVLFSEK